ncbi:MAG: apolipoprotein N-acyltransferase [Bacteroides sp.]|nr:apolipoprotein N-acyltransferase [Prevotella sp.]MCM1407113.1 apolipoprotein N-acyltransferase [Treponema brennaborense]MCM1470265.1 apolipoprotein N-acyltransferase [Bacteroides sp.]
MTTLAIPNELLAFGSPAAGLFALVPLYIAIANCRSYKMAGLLFSVQIFSVHLLSSFWLGNFHGYAAFTLGASAATYALFALYYGRFFFIPYAQARITPPAIRGKTAARRKDFIPPFKIEEYAGTAAGGAAKRIFFFAAFWTLYEWVKSSGFLAYPWGTLFMSAYKWPIVMQIADITGMWGVTFLFAFFSAVFAEGIQLLPYTHLYAKNALLPYTAAAAACIALFACTIVYGGFQLLKTRIPEKTCSLVIVQQNSDPWADGGDKDGILTSQMLTAAALGSFSAAEDGSTEKNAQHSRKAADLVVWGEAVLSRAMPQGAQYYEQHPSASPLLPFIRKTGIPFLIGGPVLINREKHQQTNSALLFSADGLLAASYAKIHLVPFAECIPYAQYPFVRAAMKKIAGFSYGWTPGSTLNLFSVKTAEGDTVRFAAPICFEDAFPSVCSALYKAGSEIFINITNDAWSKTKSAEMQHFVIAAYRAVECRTTLVRATISGFSVMLDPAGRITESLPLFTPDSKLIKAPIYKRAATTYVALGDWLPLMLLFICAALCIKSALDSAEMPRLRLADGETLLVFIRRIKKHRAADTAATALLTAAWLLPIHAPVYRTPVTCLLLAALYRSISARQREKTDFIAVTSKRIIAETGCAHQRRIDFYRQPECCTADKNSGRIRIRCSGKNIAFRCEKEDAERLFSALLQKI